MLQGVRRHLGLKVAVVVQAEAERSSRVLPLAPEHVSESMLPALFLTLPELGPLAPV